MSHPVPTVSGTDYPTKTQAWATALDRRLKGNLLVNGAFQVWQRGTSIVPTSTSYIADRWQVIRSVAGSTASRQAGAANQYAIRVQRDSGNAATTQILMGQSIESANCYGLSGLPVTLKFKARCGANYSAASSILTAQVLSGTGSDQNVLTGLTGSSTFVNQNAVLSTTQAAFEYTGTIPASTTQLGVIFAFTPTGTAGAADWFEIEECQLVVGDYAGNFPYLSFAEELALCRRYFSKTFAYATAPAQNAGVTGANVFQCAGASNSVHGTLIFPVPMRAAPTITLYNPSVANAQARNSEAAADYTSTNTFDISERSAYFNAVATAGMTATQSCRIHWAAVSEL